MFSEHVKVVFGHIRRLLIEDLPSSDPTTRKYKKTSQFRRAANSAEWMIIQELMSKINLNPTWSQSVVDSVPQSPLALMDMHMPLRQVPPAIVGPLVVNSLATVEAAMRVSTVPDIPVDEFGFLGIGRQSG